MLVGNTLQLTANILPVNATNKNVTWSSGNSAVATVNAQGLVTAVAPGTANITVTTQDKGLQAFVSITVTPMPAITSVSVSPASTTVMQGQTQQLTATVVAVGGASQTVTWTTNDSTGKVSVSSNGLVTVAQDATAGTYMITATSTVNPTKYGEAMIIVTEAPKVLNVNVEPTTASVMQGQTKQLTATVVVEGGAAQGVIWSSNDSTEKVTVNVNGLVAVAPDANIGNYIITATSIVDITKSAQATITVTPSPKVLRVSITPTAATVMKGSTQQLTAEVVVEGGAAQTVTWSSDDLSGKVTVDENGLVTVAEDATIGEYFIYAISTVNTSKYDIATVTVTEARVLTLTPGTRTVTVDYSDRDPLTNNTAATLTTQNVWVRLGGNNDLEARLTSSKPNNLTNLILTPNPNTNVVTISGNRSGRVNSTTLTVEIRDKQNPEVIASFTVVVSGNNGSGSLTIGAIQIQ